MQAQIGFSLYPLFHTDHRDRALVIGYGTGVSTRTLHEAGFKQLDMVDLSADIVRLANKHFGNVNAQVTEKTGVNTFITDGRNFLLLQDRKYDIVGLEITSIWFAGAASLYNREFYQLVKRRLQPHGVLQQWMQLHHVGNQDVLRILGSVRAEFQYVWLYVFGGQGIIVASNDPEATPTQKNVELIKRTPTMQPLLKILEQDPAELLGSRLLEPEATDRLLNSYDVPASSWVSTDDNLYLEHSTPKGNVLDGTATFDSNTKFILRRSGKNSEAQTSRVEKNAL
jgi:spermidine synthase